jgi:hypothetical protein
LEGNLGVTITGQALINACAATMPAAVTVLLRGQVIELKSVRVPAPAMAMWR